MTTEEILCLELDEGVPDLALPHTHCVTLGKSFHLREPPFPVCNMVVGNVHNSRWGRVTELLSVTNTSRWFHSCEEARLS